MEPNPAQTRQHPAHARSGARPSTLLGTVLAVLLVGFAPAAVRLAAGEEQPAPQPTPTPAPKATPTPRSTPATKPPTQAKPSAPSPTPKAASGPGPALSFSDFDLQKYHKPKPAAEESGDDEEAASPPATQASPGVPGAPAAPAAQTPHGAPAKAPDGRTTGARAPAVKRPAAPQASEDDPLRPFRDREAKEKFRSQQIQGLRDRLAQLQARLDYLQAKRQAILNPLSVMPKPPEGADTQGEATMRPKELMEKVDEEIKAVKEEQEEAQAQLASVETRFAQESQSR